MQNPDEERKVVKEGVQLPAPEKYRPSGVKLTPIPFDQFEVGKSYRINRSIHTVRKAVAAFNKRSTQTLGKPWEFILRRIDPFNTRVWRIK